jgi:uncharacterized protein (DUF1697 family)
VPSYVALLRAVNVGGRNRVAMAQLRAALEALGHEDVSTYVQSGNVVFRSPSRSASSVRSGLQRVIKDEFGLDVVVIVRTRAELAGVVERNPFRVSRATEQQLHVAFLADRPTRPSVARLDPKRSPPDEFAVVDRQVYLRCPNGMGRTKLTNDYLERQLGTSATVRNWRTVNELRRLIESS